MKVLAFHFLLQWGCYGALVKVVVRCKEDLRKNEHLGVVVLVVLTFGVVLKRL